VAALEGALATARALLDELDVARQYEVTGGPTRERPLPHPVSAGLRLVQGGGEAPPTTDADACLGRACNGVIGATVPAPAASASLLPAGLTAREAEVLRLFAVGHSNRRIAQALFLSPRTVQRHVANVYPKIGAHCRAEATAYALRHGLC